QNKDTLVVSLAVTNPDEGKLIGTLRAELVDPSDRVVASREQSISQSAKTAVYRFELIDVKQPTDRLTLRYILGKTNVEAPLKKRRPARGHKTPWPAGTELHAGTTTALRCSVHGVKNVSETVPLPMAAVEVRLKDKDGKVVSQLFRGNADAEGVAAPKVK